MMWPPVTILLHPPGEDTVCTHFTNYTHLAVRSHFRYFALTASESQLCEGKSIQMRRAVLVPPLVSLLIVGDKLWILAECVICTLGVGEGHDDTGQVHSGKMAHTNEIRSLCKWDLCSGYSWETRRSHTHTHMHNTRLVTIICSSNWFAKKHFGKGFRQRRSLMLCSWLWKQLWAEIDWVCSFSQMLQTENSIENVIKEAFCSFSKTHFKMFYFIQRGRFIFRG